MHRLLLVWCEYYADRPSLLDRKPTTQSNQAGDDMPCRISARISTDAGRTWSDAFTLQENRWRLNVKHPNLVRVSEQEIVFTFVGWDSAAQRNVFCRRSGEQRRDVERASPDLRAGPVLQQCRPRPAAELGSRPAACPRAVLGEVRRRRAVSRRQQAALVRVLLRRRLRHLEAERNSMTAPGTAATSRRSSSLRTVACCVSCAPRIAHLPQLFGRRGRALVPAGADRAAGPRITVAGETDPVHGRPAAALEQRRLKSNWPRTPLTAAVSPTKARRGHRPRRRQPPRSRRRLPVCVLLTTTRRWWPIHPPHLGTRLRDHAHGVRSCGLHPLTRHKTIPDETHRHTDHSHRLAARSHCRAARR